MQLVGWIGAGLILVSYIFIAIRLYTAESFGFALLNFAGGTMLATSSFYKKDYQAATVVAIYTTLAVSIIIAGYF